MKYKTRYYKYRMSIIALKNFRKNCKHIVRRLIKIWTNKAIQPTSYCVISEKRIAYLVIPKSACSSINKTLVGLDKDTVYSDVHKTPEVLRCLRYHLNTKEKEYFKFTFVRNPYQRIVSFWINKFYGKVQVNGLPFSLANYMGGVFNGNMTFSEMMNVIYGIPPNLANIHFSLQSHIIDNHYFASGMELNFIGKLENIEFQWKELKTRFDLQPLEQINKSTSYNYMDYYDLETLELVNEYYKEDIERFGYTDVYTEIKTYIEKKQKLKK